MIIIYFLTGLAFVTLGLSAYLQLRQGGDFPLLKQLPRLGIFGVACAITCWLDMFLLNENSPEIDQALKTLRMIAQPVTGILLLSFGWGILKLSPLPTWTIFIPGLLIVPISYAITFAATTFVTPSPIEIPIDIWSRYFLYLPGSLMAGIGFLREWYHYRKASLLDVSKLMLGAGIAFLFESFVVGLIVPAAPYGPASYYNYDRVVYNAFTGERSEVFAAYGLTSWLDYNRVLEATGLPIQFWRMISVFAVTFFVVRSLGVFEAMRKRQVTRLQEERDRAQKEAFATQIAARRTAEEWTEVLVNINRRITELDNVDSILLYIIDHTRRLLHSDFCGLALLNENRSQLLLKCHAHDHALEIINTYVPVTNPLVIQSVSSNSSYRSEKDSPPELLEHVCPLIEKPARAIAIVPIKLDNSAIGALWIARCKTEDVLYTTTDLVWLECMADQVVITIQHALMASKLQTLSIVEERARIAREMHDGLAQVLGYLNLQVQTLETLLSRGKHEALQHELRQMRQAIQTAHADVRENILSLRTTLASEKSLASAIEEYLGEFGIQTGVETQFVNRAGDLNLSSIAEVQLVCILQEALANVRKHAQARHVCVSIEKRQRDGTEYVFMEIADDGRGFNAVDTRRNFGLQTMRERANSVQGTLTIHSTLGEGTRVDCYIPCMNQEDLKVPRFLLTRTA